MRLVWHLCKKHVHCHVWGKCQFSSLFLQSGLFQDCYLLSCCVSECVSQAGHGALTPWAHLLFGEEAVNRACSFFVTWLCISLRPPLCWGPSPALPVLRPSSPSRAPSHLACLIWAGLVAQRTLSWFWADTGHFLTLWRCFRIFGRWRVLTSDLCLLPPCFLQVGMFGEVSVCIVLGVEAAF